MKRNVVRSMIALALAAAVIAMVPPLRARAKAAAVLADAVGLPFPRPFARSVDVRPVQVGGVTGDLYSPGGEAPIILFVPGAAERGRDDERVIEAATALAASNRRVFVPELHLYDRTFREEDIDRIGRAAVALAEDSEEVGVVAFSYGGSFSLVAAQDERVSAKIAFIAAFGAYYDLRHLVQGITTGVTILDGKTTPFETIPEARRLLVDSLVWIAPDSYDDELRSAIKKNDPVGLPPDARPVFDLVANDDPRRVDDVTADLPQRYRDFMTRFSPANGIDDIDVPVYLMQSHVDKATPWTEAVYLDRALEDSRLVLLEQFSHVDAPGLFRLLVDAPDAWRFVSWILAAQE